MEDSGVWLYAVVRDLDPGALTGLVGVGGAPTRAVEAEGLIAVVASVALAEFGEEQLRRNLEDLAWLEATARAHDAVIHAVARLGPTVPIRLATAYHDDDRVRALLADHHDDFIAALRRLTGRTEWGVKAYADPEASAEPANVAEPQPLAGNGSAGPGTAYLQRRRADLSARDAAQERAAAHALDIHTALGRIAVAARRYAPHDPQLTRQPEWSVLNGTYLVDDERRDEFVACVSTLAAEHRGVRLELTGPWPPYSFAGIERQTRA